MNSEFTSLQGEIKDSAGNKVSGLLVRVIDTKTQEVYGSGITGVNGLYRIKFALKTTAKLFGKKGTVAVEVIDGKQSILAKRTSFSLKLAGTTTVHWKIAKSKIGMMEPVSKPLKKSTGSIIEPSVLDLIDSAVERIIPIGQPGNNKYLRASRFFLPPISKYENLLDESWAVLEGDISAGHRLRNILSNYIDDSKGREAPEYDLEDISSTFVQGMERKPLDVDQMKMEGGISMSSGWRATEPRIIPLHRFLPVLAATLLISRDERDSRILQGALLKGLSGIGTMTKLAEAAKNTVLGGNEKTFKGHLDNIIGWCRLDDSLLPQWGPVIEATPQRDRPVRFIEFFADVEVSSAILELMWLIRLIREERETYYILDVDSCYACPGETITITGGGWGYPPGKVCFPDRVSVQNRICVDPIAWGASEIMAVVPADAGNGPITLKILEEVINTSAGTIEVYKEGTFHGNTCPPPQDEFVGGAPRINELTINGSTDDLCWPPDNDARIAWLVSPRYAVHKRLQITDGTTVYLDQDNLDPTGWLDFRTPALNITTTLDVTLTAYNMCDTVSNTRKLTIMPYRQLKIEGIEVMQGIQTFDLSDVQIDFLGQGGVNDLVTVSNKDTIVRVFISVDLGGFNNDEHLVTGELTIDGVNLAPINGITPNSATGNPIITARNRAAIDREQTDHTLNFRIPAALCSGTKQMMVRVYEATLVCSPSVEAVQFLTWEWKTKPVLPIRYVRITDNRPAPAGTGNTPTDAECEFALERAFDLLPYEAEISPASLTLMNTTHDFTTDAGLQDLLDDLDDARDDNNIWVGFSEPFNRGMAKRPGNAAISAIYGIADGQGSVLRVKTAHEIAHCLGFQHVDRCCGAGCTGPDGPHYNHPNNGNLQEVPFDPFWNQAISGSVQDFMSYGCVRWSSEINWPRLEQTY